MDSLSSVVQTIRTHKILISFAIASVTLHTLVAYFRSPWRKLPPGPRGLPLLALRRQFGDIIYLNMAGSHLVVVSSQKIAGDLLDRRAAIYSDRPRNIVASEIMSRGLLIIFTRWRRLRKASHEALKKGIVHCFHPTQQMEAALLACGLLAEADNWDGHIRRAAASSTVSIVYDEPPIVSGNHESVKEINDFVARLTRAALLGAHLVEFFPWMMYLPRILAPWRREAEAQYIQDSVMVKGLLQNVKNKMKRGEDRPSIVATLLENANRYGLSEQENSWLAVAFYAAGADTTSGVMAWWMLAMAIYPETQRRAQAELDAVVGRDRFPSFADFENLPYIHAMVKEALRWRPVVPMGFPHLSVEDDWYEGHFIPAGTTIIANVWHLNRDPEIYGNDAEHFNPARHLDEHGRIAPGPSDSKEEGHFSYGFGRRICVGRHIANDSIFINIAMILWAMNIEPATDAQGKPIPIDVDGCVDDGLVVRPVPFKIKVTPRFPEAVTLLNLERESHGIAPFRKMEGHGAESKAQNLV